MKWLHLAGLAVIGLLLAGTGCRRDTAIHQTSDAGNAQTTSVTKSSVTETAGSPITLSWSADGSRLAVNGRFTLDVRSGLFTSLPCPPERGDCAGRTLTFSPDAKEVLSIDDDLLSVDMTETGQQLQARIPRWAASNVAEDDLFNVAFWLSPQTVFVQQSDRQGRAAPTCRLVDLSREAPGGAPALRWRAESNQCFEPSFALLTAVDTGPNDLLVLHSTSEGSAALNVVRYTPERGQMPVKMPEVLLKGGVASVSFERDGSAIYIVTPCTLAETPDADAPWCDDSSDQPNWRLYRRPIGSASTELRRSDLPPDAVRHPTEDRFAWPDAGAICIGDPRDRVASRCYPSPP